MASLAFIFYKIQFRMDPAGELITLLQTPIRLGRGVTHIHSPRCLWHLALDAFDVELHGLPTFQMLLKSYRSMTEIR